MVEETEKKVRVKIDLAAQAIGTKDGTQKLVAKKDDRQLWENEKGKFGVVRVENNKYVVIQRMGAAEDAARKTLETGIVPPKPPKPEKAEKSSKSA